MRKTTLFIALAAIFAIGLVITVTAVQASDNSVTTPDTAGDVGRYAALKLDSNGNPVISYYDATNGDLKLMHCNDANCAGANESITAPDTGGDVGEHTSLALDGNSYPVVGYYDVTNGALKVLHCNDVNCAGGDESIITIDDSSLQIGWYISLALDGNGYPVVSYHDASNNALKVLHCVDQDCASIGDESITTPVTGFSMQTTSLALDSNGYPVVSFFDNTNFDLKLLRCNDPNCDGGNESLTTPDTVGIVGQSSSLKLDSDGYPVVSYYDATDQTLNVLHCDDLNCDGANDSITTPASASGWVGAFTSLQLDGDGYPVISHSIGNGLWITRCNDSDCAGGDDTTTLADSVGSPGEQTFLALDSNSYPVVSYYGRTDEDLKVLHCASKTCMPPPPTSTPTSTNTATPTNTSTATPTNTPTATSTPTNTPAATSTNTPAATPTSTATSTPTNVPSGQHDCTQADFLAAVGSGESSGVITLDGACRYLLTSANDNWNGGSGAFIFNATKLEGNGAVIERSANAPKFRILAMQVAAGLTIRNLTLRNGNVTTRGGGLMANNSVTLENVRFENNVAGDLGGALVLGQAGVLRNVTFSDNSAPGNGGAVFSFSGALTVEKSVFLRNNADNGSALFLQNGDTTVLNSLFVGNRGAVAIQNNSQGNLRIINSTIADSPRNSSTAITTWGNLTLRNSIVASYDTALSAAGGAGKVIDENFNLFANNGRLNMLYNGSTHTQGANSRQVADARFVDAANDNFRLQKSSAAVDIGSAAELTTYPPLSTDLAGATRPFSGGSVDAGAYELQDAASASLSLVKNGPPWAAPNVPFRFSIVVANDGKINATNLVVNEELPAGATYVANSASDGGQLSNPAGQQRLTWMIGDLAPGARKQLAYQVSATQDLMSASYRVTSATDSAVSALGAALTTPLNSQVVGDMGFYPLPDGFSFYNYSDSPDSDFTVEDMANTFGAVNVCKAVNPCVLNSTAASWRQKWLDNVKGGHCAGMATTSLLIYDRADITPGGYQAGALTTYDLLKANARRDIAYYAITQGETPLDQQGLPSARTVAVGATEVVSALITNLKNPSATDRYVLGFYKPDWTGGHAVTPYAVLDKGNNEYWIYVYDNNYPNDFGRVIKANKATDSWLYEGAATIPGASVSDYRSSAANKDNIILTSLRWREPRQMRCTPGACAPTVHAQGVGAADGSAIQFQLDGEGYLLITRSDGKRVGRDLVSGEIINEIDGAVELPQETGFGFNTPPVIELPHAVGMTYGLQVANRDNAYANLEAEANVNIFGDGFAVRLTGLKVNSQGATPVELPVAGADSADAAGVASTTAEPFDLISVTFAPESNRLTYQASALDGDTPSLHLAVSNPAGSDFAVAVENLAVNPQEQVALTVDPATGQVAVENNSADNAPYAVTVERINQNGTTDTFENPAMNDGAGVGVVIQAGSGWDGSTPPAVETLTAPTLPASRQVFLPLVTR